MTRKKSSVLTEVELKFMQVIWKNGEVSPELMQSELAKVNHPITGGSIRNILAILANKGYVKRRKLSKTFLYSAVVEKTVASKNIVLDLLSRLFEGSESLMVSALLKKEDISADELARIEQLLKERKKEV
jgi:BlaI family transcriptional regulator, penicillinase repressor